MRHRAVTATPPRLEPAGEPQDPIIRPVHDFLGDDVEPGERVVGVSIARDARAYPLRHLEVHAIAHDTFPGDIPVLVTYCPRTGQGAAFDRRVAGAVHTFTVAPVRVRNSLVVDDDQGNRWVAFTGECIDGPAKGTFLAPIPAHVVTWRAWTRGHSSTKVMRAPSSERTYDLDEKWVAYSRSENIEHPVENRDKRLHPKIQVAGFIHEGKPYAVTMTLLDQLGEVEIETRDGGLYVSHHEGFVGAENAYGRELTTRVAYWFAWKDFHPTTRTFTRQGELQPL